MSCCFHKKYDVKNHIHILGYGVWHKQQFSDKTINESVFSQDSYSGAQTLNRIKDWYM